MTGVPAQVFTKIKNKTFTSFSLKISKRRFFCDAGGGGGTWSIVTRSINAAQKIAWYLFYIVLYGWILCMLFINSR